MSIENLEIIVDENSRNQRLDQFLAGRFSEVSRAYLQKQIEREKILINAAPTRKGAILKLGDKIQILELLTVRERKINGNTELNIPTLYEDEDICIINKPPGIPAHPVHYEELQTVANWWVGKHPEVLQNALNDGDPLRPGIVHRLDTDTSGLMILARSQEMLLILQNQFRARTVFKEYEALVWGKSPPSGKIEFAIAHDPRSRRRMMVVKHRNDVERYKAKPSLSLFERKKFYENFQISHISVQTKTGRMHQVRVHMEGIGHPLVGDDVYKPKKINPDLFASVAAGRQMLHAARLGFLHPRTEKPLEFSCELPRDFLKVLLGLESV